MPQPEGEPQEGRNPIESGVPGFPETQEEIPMRDYLQLRDEYFADELFLELGHEKFVDDEDAIKKINSAMKRAKTMWDESESESIKHALDTLSVPNPSYQPHAEHDTPPEFTQEERLQMLATHFFESIIIAALEDGSDAEKAEKLALKSIELVEERQRAEETTTHDYLQQRDPYFANSMFYEFKAAGFSDDEAEERASRAVRRAQKRLEEGEKIFKEIPLPRQLRPKFPD